MKKSKSNRREFLALAARSGACAAAVPYFVSPAALGLDGRPPASDRIVMASIFPRQSRHTGEFLKLRMCTVAVCDVVPTTPAKTTAADEFQKTDCKHKRLSRVVAPTISTPPSRPTTGGLRRSLPLTRAGRAAKSRWPIRCRVDCDSRCGAPTRVVNGSHERQRRFAASWFATTASAN
jgi:hypothetical protein